MKRITVLIFAMLLLCGCGRKEDASVYRVVTGIDVEYQQPDGIIVRSYRNSANIESILTYIRILKPYGPVYPQGKQDSTCRITLHYSSGPDSVYIQQGLEYIQKDGGDWETVDSARASLLYPLLLLLPSDN